MNIQDIRKLIREESPTHIMAATVISADVRGTRTAMVRQTGGRVHTRVYTCTEDLDVGDQVVIARLAGIDKLIVLGKVLSGQGSALSHYGILAPPNNFSVLAAPALVYAQWDTYPGADLSWEIQYSLNGPSAYSDAAQVLVSRGSYYQYPVTPGTEVSMRGRGVRWLGDNNLMYSGWTGWTTIAAGDYEVPNLIITLTNLSGGIRVLGDVVVVDVTADNSFTTTTDAGDIDVIGIVMETIADDAEGLVCISGYCQVRINNSVTRGHYLQASATEGRADGSTARVPGTFARALESGVLGEGIWSIVNPGLSAPTSAHVTTHGDEGSDPFIEIGAIEPGVTFPGKMWVDTS